MKLTRVCFDRRFYPDWQEMCDTLDMNTHLPKPVKEEKEPEKTEQKEEEKKEEDKEKVCVEVLFVSV